MSEDLFIPSGASRAEKYEAVIPQIESLVAGETDFIANVSNILAAIKEATRFHWVGCYFVKDDELVLGPFQGSVACTRIAYGRGVCGTAWKENRVIVVPDVEAFPGHIACSSLSKSEMVIPLRDAEGRVWGVLDIDSREPDDFVGTDEVHLSHIATLISQLRRP
jgi:L-methionine (R)-S-oxide reductase